MSDLPKPKIQSTSDLPKSDPRWRPNYIRELKGADEKDLRRVNKTFATWHLPDANVYWTCSCGWEAWISHCPKCDRSDLTRVAS